MSLLVSPQKTLFYSVSDIQGIQDYVVSGLTSETPSGLTMATNAGQAFVDGLQISAAASSHAYTANKFTSDDLQSTGAIIHREYASYIDIPSLPPSGLRLRMVQTDAGAITGVFDRRTREAMLELLPETPFSWRKILDELTIGDDDYPGGTAVKKFNGAYRYAPNNGIIWYFSNIGLLYLADKIPTEIKTYLDCYIANLLDDYSAQDVNVDGNFKLDVNTTTGEPDPPKPPDSHDSYAATFLMLACKYIRTSNDWGWLDLVNARFSETNLQTLLNIATHNITQQIKTTAWCTANGFPTGYPDGHDTLLVSPFQDGYRAQDALTYDVGFTMDNCEDYRGLKDFGDLLTDLDDANAASILNFAQGIGVAVHGLYDVVNRIWVWNDTMIVWAVGDTWTADASTSGTAFYPDLFAGIFADLHAVPSTSGTLYDETRFNDGWERLNLCAPSWWQRAEYDSFPNNWLGYLATVRHKDILKGAGTLEKFFKYYLSTPPIPGTPATGTGLSGPTAGYAILSEVGFAVGIQDALVTEPSTTAATLDLGPSANPNVVLTGDDGKGLQVQDGLFQFPVIPSISVVDVSGVDVTWVSGDKFLIDGSWVDAVASTATAVMGPWTQHEIASITDDTHLVLKASAGVLTGVYFACRAGTGAKYRTILAGPTAQLPEMLAGRPYVTAVFRDPNYCGLRLETDGDVYAPYIAIDVQKVGGNRWVLYTGNDDWYGLFDILGKFFVSEDSGGGCCVFTIDTGPNGNFVAIGPHWVTPSHQLDVAGKGTAHVRDSVITPILDFEMLAWTDLEVDASDNTKMTSAAKPLGPWLIGRSINITGGTGFNIGTVIVQSVETPVQTQVWSLTAVAILALGSGYSALDVVDVDGGTGGTVRIDSVDGSGGVTAVTLLTGGSGYGNLIGVTTTGGGGSGLTLNTTARASGTWRAKCSAAVGTVGSTGGVGALLGQGIYWGGIPVIDMIAGGYVRVRNSTVFQDASANRLPVYASLFDAMSGFYISGYQMIGMIGSALNLMADVIAYGGGSYKAVDCGLLNIGGVNVIDAALNGSFTNIYTKSDVYTKAEVEGLIAAAIAGLTHSHALPANTGGGGSPDHTHTLGGNTGDSL